MLRPVILSAALLAALALSACSRTESAPQPIRAVKLIKVGQGTVSTQAEFAAEIRARTESRLSFQVAGKLQHRLVDLGQTVRAGQVLAVLDPQDYQANAQAAAAQLQAAQSQFELAQADLRRYESLRDQGFISGAEFERRQVALKTAQAGLKQAQAAASVLANQAAYTRLLADADGVIVGTEAESGQVLAPGAAVLRLAHNGPRDAFFVVPEDQVSAIRVGQPVVVQAWSPSGERASSFNGRVREVAASADPVTRTFSVRAALQQGTLALGSTASVHFSAADPAQTVTTRMKLPMTAIWRQGNDSVVWVFDAKSSTVHARKVQVAASDGNQAVLAGGLSAAEEVVVVGTHVLTEGQQVTRFVASAAAQPATVPLERQP